MRNHYPFCPQCGCDLASDSTVGSCNHALAYAWGAELGGSERIARHPDGQLMVERLPLPTMEQAERLLASLAKAYPYLADHAPHIDGEFDNALHDLRRLVQRLLPPNPERDRHA